jgi:vacuolar-type H+-ATPase subunit H
MKIFIKFIGFLLLVLAVAIVAIPYFYRDQIAEIVKEEINKNVNATVDFGDFNLSLLRSFPHFNFQLQDLSVINKTPFEGDTLAYIPEFGLTIDLMSVITGDAPEVTRVDISNPVVNALVLEDGAANWDIVPESGEVPAETQQSTASSPLLIKLKSVAISDARIIYNDKSLVTYVVLEGVNHRLSGDFTMDFTSLDTYTTVEKLSVNYDGMQVFDNIGAELDALIDADLANFIFTLRNNELRLNDLFLEFDGTIGMHDNGDYSLMLSYASKNSDFKSFLSLIPALYMKDFETLQTSGSLNVNGNVKGVYSENAYPGFALNILVENGFFQYPDLPKAVENVNIETRIAFPGGDLDLLTVDIPEFRLAMAGNQLSASLSIKNPMTDVVMKGGVTGKMNLGQVKEFYPLEEGDALSGVVTSNVSFSGKMSDIENEQYERFNFMGSVLMEGFSFQSAMLPEMIAISKAQLNFAPEYLDLVSFNMNLGRNDISAKGKIENFLPYFFNDGLLKGNLNVGSNYLNLSDLMPEADSTTAALPETPAETADSLALSVIEIPGNIDFTMAADFKTVVYDNIELKNMNGRLLVKDAAINLENLKMEVLDGTIGLSGKYDTKDPAKPTAAMAINISNIDIQQAYTTFGTLEKFAPIAEKTQGKFSTNFSINTLLDDELMPVYNTMNGGGGLQTSRIVVENVNSINKLADALKMPELKRLALAPVSLNFEFINGVLHVKPFDIKYEDVSMNIGGWTSFEQIISYDLVLTIPRAKFGGAANAVLDNLVNQANSLGTNFSIGDNVNVKGTITGTISDPKVSIMPGEGSGSNMMEEMKRRAQEELERQKQKLEEEARRELEKQKEAARKEADKIIADANKQAEKILADAQQQVDAANKTARDASENIKVEARNQADKIMAEAKKKGPLAEIAARATTKKIVEEAESQADSMVKEAERQSEKIMEQARQQAEKVKTDARSRADKLLQ